MPGKARTLYEGETLRVIQRGSNGKKEPRHILVSMDPKDGVGWSRHMKMTIEELFDLTEALDDICDTIEDEEDGNRERLGMDP